jgi:hypothetical protein
MNKFHKRLFFATPNKVIWPHGLKSAILAIFQKLADWLDWQIENDWKWLYQLIPIKYDLKLPSEVTPGLLPFRSRSKQCAVR